MSEIITYKIKLTPLDWYFFGGETTFGEEGQSQNYYAKSNLLPQETALLGMLRYELLKLNGLLPITNENRTRVNALIGSNSFNYENKDNPEEDFGAIRNISPVFLGNGNTVYYKTPKHCGRNIDFDINSKCCFTNQSKNIKLPHISGFSSKEYESECWISFDDTSDSQDTSVVFQSKTRIGIIAGVRSKKEQDKAFYKVEMKKLKNDFHFVFYASFDKSQTNELPSESRVKLGAERSTFSMQAEKVDSNYKPVPDSLDVKNGQLVCLSDAFVDQKVLELCKFAWIDTIPFRNLKTTTDKKNYASLSAEEKSNRFNLLERGSVLFFAPDKRDEIVKLIDNHYLQNFGYNIYKIR